MFTAKSTLNAERAAARDLLDELHTLSLHSANVPPWTLHVRLRDAARQLSTIERATVRATVHLHDGDTAYPLTIQSAVLRLAIWDARGVLDTMSGQDIARSLQGAMGNTHPRALRDAAEGWALLAAADAASGSVRVEVSTPDDQRGYRRIRLIERLVELDHNHNHNI